MTQKPVSPVVAPDDILAAFNTHEDLIEDKIDRAAEKETALQAVAYVLGKNYKAAEASAEEGVFSIAIKLTFDRNEVPTSIKAVARSSRISKADITLNCPLDD